MPYPPIPRDESGAPFPVVWDAQIKNWRIYEGTKVLYGPNGEPMFTVQNPGVVKVDDANPVKVQLSGTNLALRQTIVTGAKTVVSTAAEIFAGASRLDNRHAMVVTNTGADIVYIGAVGVTTSNGFPLVPQDTLRIEFDPTSSVGVFACTSGTNVQVRVVELA